MSCQSKRTPHGETTRTWFLHFLDSELCQSRYLFTQLVSHLVDIVADLHTTIQGTRKNNVIHKFRLGMQHDLECCQLACLLAFFQLTILRASANAFP